MKIKLLFLFIILSQSSFGQHKWIEPNQLDTLISLSNDVSVKLSPHGEIHFDEYYLVSHVLDSISALYGNFHMKSLAIENYKLGEYADQVKREGNQLSVKLANGNWHRLENNIEFNEVGHAFEFYFEDLGFYSIRVQWVEGNAYKLVNAKNGEVTNLIGRPYFSPTGKFLISLGNDIEAGYSINGFQLLKNESGKITEVGRCQPSSWGCESAYWLNDYSLILKNESIEVSEYDMSYFQFFTKLHIQ